RSHHVCVGPWARCYGSGKTRPWLLYLALELETTVLAAQTREFFALRRRQAAVMPACIAIGL
ncbi:hypothetical protein, partial [Paraburkholderia hospita]|uniref:hypothetical protein n=1 Tax=Paraburkholderia hospita TaxID=169430 RepID=UPI001A99FA7F